MKTKLYFLIVGIIVQFALVFGFIGPFLISIKDDAPVILGFVICICWIPFGIWQVKKCAQLGKRIANNVTEKIRVSKVAEIKKQTQASKKAK